MSLMGGLFSRLLGGLTTGLFAAYLIALSPHLVHHLFDENYGGRACPYLAQSQQTPGLQPDPPSLTPPDQVAAVPTLPSGASLPAPDLTLGDPRAPPAPHPPSSSLIAR